MNESAALHPHAVDVENRHNLFLVVKSKTICQTDFAVKSISAFVAPRGFISSKLPSIYPFFFFFLHLVPFTFYYNSCFLGASSSKWFTSIIIVMCISGMFGSFRWYKVGDAGIIETVLVT